MPHPLFLVGSYAGADQPGVHAFHLHPESGQLTPAGVTAGLFRPSFLTLHPNRRWVYTVSEAARGDASPGAVWALQLAEAGAPLRRLNHQPSNGDWPCHVALDGNGQWLVTSNYGSGSATVYPVLADGQLGPASDQVRHSGQGPNTQRQEGPHAHSALFTPDNAYVLIADLGLDAVMMYAFDGAAGRLRLHAEVRTRPGAGPRHMAFNPAGDRLYVANELDNTVAVFDYDAAAAAFQPRQVVETLPPGAPENTVADLHLGGGRLYVSNRGHNSLAVFEITAEGGLHRVAVASCGGDWPRNFALAPGGRFVVVANQNSGTVDVLPLRSGPEAVGAPVASAPVPTASCVCFVTDHG